MLIRRWCGRDSKGGEREDNYHIINIQIYTEGQNSEEKEFPTRNVPAIEVSSNSTNNEITDKARVWN